MCGTAQNPFAIVSAALHSSAVTVWSSTEATALAGGGTDFVGRALVALVALAAVKLAEDTLSAGVLSADALAVSSRTLAVVAVAGSRFDPNTRSEAPTPIDTSTRPAITK